MSDPTLSEIDMKNKMAWTIIKIKKNPFKEIHNTEMSFICPICSKAFRRKKNLSSHMKTHKKYEDRRHECEFCDKKFHHRATLNIHLRTHTGEKPYKCDECDYACTIYGNLTKHKNNKHKKSL